MGDDTSRGPARPQCAICAGQDAHEASSVGRANLLHEKLGLMGTSPTEPPESRNKGDVVPPRSRPKPPRWPLWFVPALVLLAGLAGLAWFVTLPFYALWPGPVEEVSDLVKVERGPTLYELNGDMYMLTVTLQEVNAFELAQSWLDPRIDVVRREVIRPEGVTREEHRKVNLRLMDNSKQAAIEVALRFLGLPVDHFGEGMLVTSVAEGSPADGLLEVGDVIVKVGESAVSVREDGIEAILANEIGDTVPLTVLRGDSTITLDVTLVEHSQDPGRPMVGFVPETHNRSLDLPFDVEIETHGTGGPSAGVMYALTLIDLLTEQDLIGGNIVAGTGTISPDGRVGPIGGVRQKVVAAQNAGARFVLVPDENYADAVTVKRDGVEIHAISSIEGAVHTLEEIATR